MEREVKKKIFVHQRKHMFIISKWILYLHIHKTGFKF